MTKLWSKVLVGIATKDFGWMERSIIVFMDVNSMKLLIFYITEAITISTAVFSHR